MYFSNCNNNKKCILDYVNRCALSVIKLKYKILYRRQALITIQKTVKMHLARSQHEPRYRKIDIYA